MAHKNKTEKNIQSNIQHSKIPVFSNALYRSFYVISTSHIRLTYVSHTFHIRSIYVLLTFYILLIKVFNRSFICLKRFTLNENRWLQCLSKEKNTRRFLTILNTPGKIQYSPAYNIVLKPDQLSGVIRLYINKSQKIME